MNDEVDAFGGGNTDLQQDCLAIRTDQHRQVVELEHTGRVAVGVEHVFISDPVLPSTCQDHRIHSVSTYLDTSPIGCTSGNFPGSSIEPAVRICPTSPGRSRPPGQAKGDEPWRARQITLGAGSTYSAWNAIPSAIAESRRLGPTSRVDTAIPALS